MIAARCAQLSKLAGASARELSELARTFLRHADGRLYVGIYYSRWLIEQLERYDPRAGLSDRNIRSLIAFVEEINHAVARRTCSSKWDSARSLRKILFVTSNSRRASILIWCCSFSSLSFEKPRRFHARIDVGSAFTFSLRRIPARLKHRICAAVISKRRIWLRVTHYFSIRLMECDALKRSGLFVRSITPEKKSASSR